MAFKKMLHIWCGLLPQDLLPPTEPFEGYWGMMGSLALQQDRPPQSAARSFLENLPKAVFCTSYHRTKSKSKVWKGCEGLVEGSLLSNPVHSLWCHFLFMEGAGGERSRQIQVWGCDLHTLQRLLYWSLESCAYWQERVPPPFRKLISGAGQSH